jgi:tRNA-specific 2-thiouridylase
VDCNTTVKFGALLGQARHLYGCEAVATGHYARRGIGRDGQVTLIRARDESKDQTYFLYGLRQDQLADARFPLGELTKTEVRDVARGLGLATADKPESQEVCFVPGGDYRDALRQRAGWTPEPGPLVDTDGVRVGEHRGAAAYTVGQRSGLGVALGEPRYVARIDPGSNLIQLGRRAELETRTIEIEGVTFVAGDSPPLLVDGGFRAEVRIRHRAPLVPATVRPADPDGQVSGSWIAETDAPVWAVSPGQACVLYAGDVCLGGGRIARPPAWSASDGAVEGTSRRAIPA